MTRAVRTERDMPGTWATRKRQPSGGGTPPSRRLRCSRLAQEGALARGRLRAGVRGILRMPRSCGRHEGLPVVRAEAAIGAGGLWLHELRVTDERAAFLALVRDALSVSAGRPDLQRRLQIRLTAEAAYDGTGKLAELEACVDEARDAGDSVALAEGLSLLHHAMLTPQYAHERIAVADELMGVAAPLETRTLVLMGMCWRTVDLLLLGHGEAEHGARGSAAAGRAVRCPRGAVRRRRHRHDALSARRSASRTPKRWRWRAMGSASRPAMPMPARATLPAHRDPMDARAGGGAPRRHRRDRARDDDRARLRGLRVADHRGARGRRRPA